MAVRIEESVTAASKAWLALLNVSETVCAFTTDVLFVYLITSYTRVGRWLLVALQVGVLVLGPVKVVIEAVQPFSTLKQLLLCTSMVFGELLLGRAVGSRGVWPGGFGMEGGTIGI